MLFTFTSFEIISAVAVCCCKSMLVLLASNDIPLGSKSSTGIIVHMSTPRKVFKNTGTTTTLEKEVWLETDGLHNRAKIWPNISIYVRIHPWPKKKKSEYTNDPCNLGGFFWKWFSSLTRVWFFLMQAPLQVCVLLLNRSLLVLSGVMIVIRVLQRNCRSYYQSRVGCLDAFDVYFMLIEYHSA